LINENINNEKPNWLLYGLIAVSIVIHAAFFLEASGLFNFKKISYFEIGVRKELKPQTRQIPRPRKRLPAADTHQKVSSSILSDNTDPVIEPVPDKKENFNPDKSVPDSASPSEDIPEEIALDIAEFSTPVVKEAGGFGPRMDYLDMVRLKIESRKQYPPFSRQRNMEGMVTVEFMIGVDGFISGLIVVRSSGFASLDEAAVAAVNSAAPFPPPPDKYFKQQVRVKVPIAFELIQ